MSCSVCRSTLAAAVRGSSLPTRDIDIVPSRTPDNLERLGRAFRRMGAQIRTDGDPVPAPLDGPFLANMPFMLNLVTEFGEMDLTFVPAGRAGGYEGWRIGATNEEVSEGLLVAVAALDDVIDSKRAANRRKTRWPCRISSHSGTSSTGTDLFQKPTVVCRSLANRSSCACSSIWI